jgi:integrase/recombinase XerD
VNKVLNQTAGIASNSPATTPIILDCDDLLAAFTSFLRFDVANGGASGDTIVTYWNQVKQYLGWCQQNGVQPRDATRETIKIYRWWLTEQQQYKSKTIAVKLSAVSRFYDAAVEYGTMTHNPVWGIKPPAESIDPAARITYLESNEATILLQSIDRRPSLKNLRDRLLLGMMTLEGTRTVEMHRVNIGDIYRQGQRVGITVKSKRRTRVVPLLPQLAEILDLYIQLRRERGVDAAADSPLFISLGNQNWGERLQRRGIRKIIDFYLNANDLKYREGRTLSAHSLRHTAGTLALRGGASLRQVQDLLGHADPRTTSIYAHVGDRWDHNPALKLGIDL